MDPYRILGIDLALNHTGFVLVDSKGEIIAERLVTDIKSASKKSNATLLDYPKTGDKGADSVVRLKWWDKFLPDLFRELRPTHIGIEDYAMRVESNAVYQIGELGGVARLHALKAGALLRLHDPLSVKMFGAELGNATGWEVAEAVRDVWKQDFSAYNPAPPKNPKQKQNTLPQEDMSAAYIIARLVQYEILLRDGKLNMASLSPKKVQVFNRVTKTYPTNLLGREFIR